MPHDWIPRPADVFLHVWSEQEDAILRAGWGAGLSCSQIARMLPSRTRDAVIGRAHRLHLPARPSPIKRPEKPQDIAFGHGCQWIDGNPADGKCGASLAHDGAPYCEAHMARAYIKTEAA